MKELAKAYNPAEHEEAIYKRWEDSGAFAPGEDSGKRTFSIMMPPPNVTGTLHLGHAFEHTQQDVLIRYHRMRGDRTLWLPGTDHAAIATQSKYEKELTKKEGKSRHDFSRDEFVEQVHRFALENQTTILAQLKRLGDSVDWSRLAFTLDAPRERAVRTAFKRMYDEGLIYRGHRIVNWDPKGQTTISDDEIVYKEETAKLYYFQYGPFVIATARPETKFGDKYVVVHPNDKRYAAYEHGQKLELEWINGPMTATVIKDPVIDMSFGTGVMTITPWHSQVDFEIAERHGLDKEQIIDERAKLLPIAAEFAGMKIAEARPQIVEKLRAKGLVVKEEPYTHNIATAERTGGVIEPQIKLQWFVDVDKKFQLAHSELKVIKTGQEVSLKDIMRSVVASGEITILPDHFGKIYTHWVDNLHDWCISRQILFGHRIPVWYRQGEVKDQKTKVQTDKEEIYVGVEAPVGDDWVQDEDTLDTWFSSGLWTFSTLGWPDKTSDLDSFHPTTVMNPGYEILALWVSRMVMFSGYLLGQVPFKTVLFHGIVRDRDGRKFSKSLNNGIDPLDVIDTYGTDALRMALTVGIAPGSDTKFDFEKVKAYKHFANKLWNISRFVLMNHDADNDEVQLNSTDQTTLTEFHELVAKITDDMENYRLYLAAENLYHYVWHSFADKILEEMKPRLSGEDSADRQSAQKLLMEILAGSLKLLHPFMPFVTEAIWAELPASAHEPMLMTARWPSQDGHNS